MYFLAALIALFAAAVPARAATRRDTLLGIRPIDAIELPLSAPQVPGALSRQDVLDEIDNHYYAITPHMGNPETMASKLSDRILTPGTPYARVLAGQALVGAFVKQQAFLQVRHHLLTQGAGSPIARAVLLYQGDRGKRRRLNTALEPLRRAVSRVAARDRDETRDILDRLFLDDSLPAHAPITLAPANLLIEAPAAERVLAAEGQARVGTRIWELRRNLADRVRTLGFHGDSAAMTIGDLERLRGTKSKDLRVDEVRGILAELRVLESLQGELLDAHQLIRVPHLGEVGEIDGETADHFIEVSSGKQDRKTRQLKLLAKYALSRGKKGLIVYVDADRAGTRALGRFVEIGLASLGSIEFRPIPWR